MIAQTAEFYKTNVDGLDIVCTSRSCWELFNLTAHPHHDNPNPYLMLEKIADFAESQQAHILSADVFGPCQLHAAGIEHLQQHAGAIRFPITWLEGDRRETTALTGVQAYAVRGVTPTPVNHNDQLVGHIIEDDDARYAYLGNLHPPNPAESRSDQTQASLKQLGIVLDSIGMGFHDVVRTWMYADHILDWYDDFNEARTDFFRSHDVFTHLVPASTGIGVINSRGTPLVIDAFALQPKATNRIQVEAVASPLQCPAPEYGSSFSRAAEIQLGDHRRLYVSGTASIEPGGETVHVGDVDKQIELSMDVVEAILTSRGMTWADISRADAYFRHLKDFDAFHRYCQNHALPPLPIAMAQADICRDDLLFEIEADAITAGSFRA